MWKQRLLFKMWLLLCLQNQIFLFNTLSTGTKNYETVLGGNTVKGAVS